jgi:NAD(P)-dependent dehydrogenase (short-subunit alcohol dehydrogenase family)
MSGDTGIWQGKVAVITGAASGIGRGLAEHAAQQNMQLVLADVNADALEKLVAELDLKQAITVTTDVSDLKSVKALAQRAFEVYGQVDLLFNNAGVMTTGLSWEIDPAVFQRTLDININGVLNGVRAFLPRMKEQVEGGRIVNTASMGGLLSSPLMAPYSISKFAVVAYSESLRAELEMLELPVAVSVLCPGPVQSGIFNRALGDVDQPAVQHFVQRLSDGMMKNGITPKELARRAFRDMDEGKFWLIPQPESLRKGFERRCKDILNHCR